MGKQLAGSRSGTSRCHTFDDLSHKDSYLVQSRIPEYVSSFTPLCKDCSRVLITGEKEERQW